MSVDFKNIFCSILDGIGIRNYEIANYIAEKRVYMNFDDLFYYLNYGRTRKQKKRDLMFLRTLFFIKLATLILMIVMLAIYVYLLIAK